jgi:hypothetical protein
VIVMGDVPRSSRLARPSGQVEPLTPARPFDEFVPYMTPGERAAAGVPKPPAERRRRRRRGSERLAGRLVDVEA